MYAIFESIISIFNNLPTIVASLGLILATSSFISGLQLVKAASIIEGKIHRFNGITSIILYLVLAGLSIKNNGFYFGSFMAWLSGILIISLKLWIVKKKRAKRRAFKYVSWIGGTLIIIWLFLVYISIPVNT